MPYRLMILTKIKFLGFVKICSNWLDMEMCHLLISEVIQEELSKSIEYVWIMGHSAEEKLIHHHFKNFLKIMLKC